MRLGIKDHKVIAAFVDRRPAEGLKLHTDGRVLSGYWLGGARIAEWTKDGIRLNDVGSRAGESVHQHVKGHATPVQLEGYRPSKKLRSGISHGSRDTPWPKPKFRVGERVVSLSSETRGGKVEGFTHSDRAKDDIVYSVRNDRGVLHKIHERQLRRSLASRDRRSTRRRA